MIRADKLEQVPILEPSSAGQWVPKIPLVPCCPCLGYRQQCRLGRAEVRAQGCCLGQLGLCWEAGTKWASPLMDVGNGKVLEKFVCWAPCRWEIMESKVFRIPQEGCNVFIPIYTQDLLETFPASTLWVITSLFISALWSHFCLGEKYQTK